MTVIDTLINTNFVVFLMQIFQTIMLLSMAITVKKLLPKKEQKKLDVRILQKQKEPIKQKKKEKKKEKKKIQSSVFD